MKHRFLNILFWSVISAAFIGPGTVTTAALAGSQFRLELLWALTFSTIACLVLQEASARLTIVSGKTLGEALQLTFRSVWVGRLVAGAVAFGCAAYQAGNLAGAVAGLQLVFEASDKLFLASIGITGALLLAWGKDKKLSQFLGGVVALMGFWFLLIAFLQPLSGFEIIQHLITPSLPEGSSKLVIGLVGTTIVPYNLFLISGISSGKSLSEMRAGLSVAIGLGGLISMGVLQVGTSVEGDFSFLALGNRLSQEVGEWATYFFGFGLFAAGFTSCITAPLAAGLALKSVASGADKAFYYHFGWGLVMLAGLAFGLSGIKPIPLIVGAQAINGALLPLIALVLFWVVNEKKLMAEHTNSSLQNMGMCLILAIAIFLGLNSLARLLTETSEVVLFIIAGASITISFLLFWRVKNKTSV